MVDRCLSRVSPLAALLLGLFISGTTTAAKAALTVEYWAENRSRKLRTVKSHPPGSRVLTVEELPLVLKEPALVRSADATFTLEREGMYRFRGSGKVVRQTLVYRGDVWRLAGHLSRFYVYGRRHQPEDVAKQTERARCGEPISLQCGDIAKFVVQHLNAQGIGARVVNCVSGSDWNYFDDGHVLMELRDPVEKRWVLYDPTLGARYRHEGRWLDLLDMTQLYHAGKRAAKVEFVNAGSKIDPLTSYEKMYGPFLPNEKALAAYLKGFRGALSNDSAAIHRWYGRVMQIPMIGGCMVPGSDAEDALLRTLPGWKGLERLTPEQFRKRFYPD